jgi:hypothetical protein|tara:strand:- start:411 stop:773 length:363 start_codon:yes stop_codon:yes gene_type:complete
MTYIILQTVYCITFSVACFLILKKIYTKKLKELEEIYQKGILACESLEDKNHELYIKKINQAYQKNIDNIKELQAKQNISLVAIKHEASKENKSYLLQMNKDISFKIKELTDTIKNKPII